MRRKRLCGGVLESLQPLKFLPAGFTLFYGKAHPSGSWGGGGCLTSAQQDGHLLRRPRRPNQLGGSVVVLVHVASWVVVAVVGVWGKRSREMLLVCVVLYEVAGLVLSHKRMWVMVLVW